MLSLEDSTDNVHHEPLADALGFATANACESVYRTGPKYQIGRPRLVIPGTPKGTTNEQSSAYTALLISDMHLRAARDDRFPRTMYEAPFRERPLS